MLDFTRPTEGLKSAKVLREEVLETGGSQHRCYVIEAQYEKKPDRGAEYTEANFAAALTRLVAPDYKSPPGYPRP